MMPQLTVVEMLLAGASENFDTGQLEVACRMIAQAASILDQIGLPAPQALDSVPLIEMAPVAEMVPVAEMAVALKATPEPRRVMAAAA